MRAGSAYFPKWWHAVYAPRFHEAISHRLAAIAPNGSIDTCVGNVIMLARSCLLLSILRSHFLGRSCETRFGVQSRLLPGPFLMFAPYDCFLFIRETFILEALAHSYL